MAEAHCDPLPVKALARVFRWRRMLEEGRHVSTRELAAEKGDASQAARLLRRTLLAPYLVEAILDGRDAYETAPRFLATITADGWTRREVSGRRLASLRRAGR